MPVKANFTNQADGVTLYPFQFYDQIMKTDMCALYSEERVLHKASIKNAHGRANQTIPHITKRCQLKDDHPLEFVRKYIKPHKHYQYSQQISQKQDFESSTNPQRGNYRSVQSDHFTPWPLILNGL